MFYPLFDLNHASSSLRRFDSLASLFEEVQQLFAEDQRGPAVNVYHHDAGAAIEVAVPGYRPQQLSLEVDRDTVVINGEATDKDSAEATEHQANGQRLRQEIRRPRFTRRIQLPFIIDSEQTVARHENGVLSIAVAKPRSEQPRQIAIAS